MVRFVPFVEVVTELKISHLFKISENALRNLSFPLLGQTIFTSLFPASLDPRICTTLQSLRDCCPKLRKVVIEVDILKLQHPVLWRERWSDLDNILTTSSSFADTVLEVRLQLTDCHWRDEEYCEVEEMIEGLMNECFKQGRLVISRMSA